MTGREQVIARVFGLYERFGTSDYIGEPVFADRAHVPGCRTRHRRGLR